MYRVSVEKRTLAWLRSQAGDVRKQLGFAIHRLQEDPGACNTKTLVGVKFKGASIQRLRVGDYRVAFQIDKGRVLILVIHIGDRKEIYEELRRKVKEALEFGGVK